MKSTITGNKYIKRGLPHSCLTFKSLAVEKFGGFLLGDVLRRLWPSNKSCPSLKHNASNSILGKSFETVMYPQSIQNISSLAPETKFVDAREHMCIIGSLSLQPSDSLPAGDTRSEDTIASFSTVEVWIGPTDNAIDDLFENHGIDQFLESSPYRATCLFTLPFENVATLAERMGMHLTSCAIARLDSQLRHFAPPVLIMDNQACLVRRERIGIAGTGDPLILVNFIWRFSRSSPCQRGIHHPVWVAATFSPREARSIIEFFQLEPEIPLLQCEIPGNPRIPPYFAHRLPRSSLCDIGRSSHVLHLYELDNKRPLYLEDSRYTDADEGETREGRHTHTGHPRVPLFDHGSDLTDETTTEALVLEVSSSVEATLIEPCYTHHRTMVCWTPFMFTEGVVQILKAHRQHNTAEILHRDISFGNILVDYSSRPVGGHQTQRRLN